jgi:hypothetical protein
LKSEDFFGEKYLVAMHKLSDDTFHACSDVIQLNNGVAFRHHLVGEERVDVTRPEYGVGFTQLPVTVYKRSDDFAAFILECDGELPNLPGETS